jgi:hypothetical protein
VSPTISELLSFHAILPPCTHPQGVLIDATLRSIAGILLKNNIRWSQNISFAINDYIQRHVFLALQEPEMLVRNVTANLIATIISAHELESWPSAIPTLIAIAAQTDEEHTNLVRPCHW